MAAHLADLLEGVALALGILIGVALFHKGHALLARRAGEEPLILALAPRHADALLSAACATEVLVVVLLILEPTLGLGALSALLVGYTIALRRLPRDADCRCFGAALKVRSRKAAIARNLALLAVATSCAIALAVIEHHERTPVSQAGLGGIALFGAIVAAFELLNRVAVKWRSPQASVITGSTVATK